MAANNTSCASGLQYGLLAAFAAIAIVGCGGSGSGGGGGGVGGGAPGAPSPAPAPAPTPAPAPAPAAPSIVTQPASAAVADGAVANFSVTAAGDAPLSYQWRRNGTDLANGAGVSGATTATMSLTAPFIYNASQISVRVTNAVGNVVSGNASLTVAAAVPTITAQPMNTTAIVGDPTILSARISGGTAPITYQWKRDGKAIAGATSETLTIAMPDFRDNGAVFVLDIANPAGTLSTQPATLMVVPNGASKVFNVNTTDDLVDADSGDAECITSANNCSLRAAVMTAEVSGLPVTVINVPAGTYKLTRAPSENPNPDGANGNLNISAPGYSGSTIYITGAGAARTIIDAGGRDNVLDVGVGRGVTLNGLTLRNGQSLYGGIILNREGSSLLISDCVIENGHTLAEGGGINNQGTLFIHRSTIRSNTAFDGGGVASIGTTRVYESTISGNQADTGGGIVNFATTYLLNSTVSMNSADTNGGGIFARDGFPGSEVNTVIVSSSIIGNDADHDHDEDGGNGGGVYVSNGSRLALDHALFARNTVMNSPQYDDCYGGFVELYGRNAFAEDNGNCIFIFLGGGRSSWVSNDTVDPALKDNGGPTFTHAIIDGPNSARYDGFGYCLDVETGSRLTTDQRGAPRGVLCDIGAYQFGAVVP